MRSIHNSLLPCMILVLTMGAGLTGCASRQPQRAESGNLYIETLPSTLVYFSDTAVQQKGDKLIVSGKVSRQNKVFSGAGWVDIAVVSAGERVIEKGSVPYTPPILQKTPGARRHHSSTFEARFRCQPPPWSVIRIAYHPKAGSESDAMERENVALPEDIDYGG